MNPLQNWQRKWGLPDEAIADLSHALTSAISSPPPKTTAKGEARVQARVRAEAHRHGMLLFRNNVGATQAKDGRLIRYGLANESREQNKRFKSSDLIGIKRVVIDPSYLGRTVGLFAAIECKREGWEYGKSTGKDRAREEAQFNFLALVQQHGGYARWSTGGL